MLKRRRFVKRLYLYLAPGTFMDWFSLSRLFSFSSSARIATRALLGMAEWQKQDRIDTNTEWKLTKYQTRINENRRDGLQNKLSKALILGNLTS